MPTTDVKIQRFARWLLDQFSEADRRRVLETVESLRHSSPDQWPRDRVTPHSHAVLESVYKLSVPPGILVFLHWSGPGELEIIDVMWEELYRFMLESSNGAGARK